MKNIDYEDISIGDVYITKYDLKVCVVNLGGYVLQVRYLNGLREISEDFINVEELKEKIDE